ncbi:MAG: thiol-disulfide oxidoreductase DCC family protein [Neptuniibacter sp.]
MRIKNTTKPIVFYDGGCPLCKKEISHYMGLDRESSIVWIDITEQYTTLKSHGISLQQAMAELHAVTDAAVVVKGVDSFLLIWENLRFYRLLAKVVVCLRLNKPLNFIYNRFARWRLRKRCESSCVVGSARTD